MGTTTVILGKPLTKLQVRVWTGGFRLVSEGTTP